MPKDADIIVVGAGITGSYVGARLSGLGHDVIMIEKEEARKEDSGMVSKRFFRYAPKSIARHGINEMQFISPSGKSFSLRGKKPFAWIVNRNSAIRHMRKGCRRIRNERVMGVSTGKDSALVRTDSGAYRCRLVIGCDGAHSVVRRSLGGKNPKIIHGMLTRTKPARGSVKVFLNKYYSPDFFGWIIPQAGEWGIMSGVNPKDYFEYFEMKEKLQRGRVHSAPIPMGFVKSSFNRAMLVGEAAGQTKPLTGGGYVFGLECAQFAIKAADLCVQQNNFSEEFISSAYDRWKKYFAAEIRKQLVMRSFYRRMTNSQIDKIFDTLGHHAETAEVKDYDLLSKTFMQMPKTAIIKAGIQAIL